MKLLLRWTYTNHFICEHALLLDKFHLVRLLAPWEWILNFGRHHPHLKTCVNLCFPGLVPNCACFHGLQAFSNFILSANLTVANVICVVVIFTSTDVKDIQMKKCCHDCLKILSIFCIFNFLSRNIMHYLKDSVPPVSSPRLSSALAENVGCLPEFIFV